MESRTKGTGRGEESDRGISAYRPASTAQRGEQAGPSSAEFLRVTTMGVLQSERLDYSIPDHIPVILILSYVGGRTLLKRQLAYFRGFFVIGIPQNDGLS